MKVLITGGNGFLGLHMANFLLKKGVFVRLVDIAPLCKEEFSEEIEYYQEDVRNLSKMEKITKDIDILIHAAAALPLWKKKEIYSINIGGAKNCLLASLKNKVKRFIFISSTAVYGIPKKIPMEEDDPLTKGVGPYGESKIIAEELCSSFRQKGLTVAILRPKTFIGTHRLGIFQILYEWVYENKKIPLIGKGNNRYQLLEVEDLCKAIWLCMNKEEILVNETFNVGAEEFLTVRQDLENFFKEVGSLSQVFPTPLRLTQGILRLLYNLKLSPLYPWVYATAGKNSYVSIEKIKNKLGWHPSYSNWRALANSYRWYLQHRQEILPTRGITHRCAWKEGILKLIKAFM